MCCLYVACGTAAERTVIRSCGDRPQIPPHTRTVALTQPKTILKNASLTNKTDRKLLVSHVVNRGNEITEFPVITNNRDVNI